MLLPWLHRVLLDGIGRPYSVCRAMSAQIFSALFSWVTSLISFWCIFRSYLFFLACFVLLYGIKIIFFPFLVNFLQLVPLHYDCLIIAQSCVISDLHKAAISLLYMYDNFVIATFPWSMLLFHWSMLLFHWSTELHLCYHYFITDLQNCNCVITALSLFAFYGVITAFTTTVWSLLYRCSM
jgi:hypothetical protein